MRVTGRRGSSSSSKNQDVKDPGEPDPCRLKNHPMACRFRRFGLPGSSASLGQHSPLTKRRHAVSLKVQFMKWLLQNLLSLPC